MGSSALILIIEDDAATRELMGNVLMDEGYDVVVAESGASALIQLDLALPDLITLDLGLFDVDGLALLHMLRQRAETSSIPIVVVSARGALPHDAFALSQAQVAKPFDLEDLLGAVRAALGG